MILAAVPSRVAGSAGGVLSTANQIGGSIGIAALGTLFFTRLTGSGGSDPAAVFGDALAEVLLWQVRLYLAAAALMTLLPKPGRPDELAVAGAEAGTGRAARM